MTATQTVDEHESELHGIAAELKAYESQMVEIEKKTQELRRRQIQVQVKRDESQQVADRLAEEIKEKYAELKTLGDAVKVLEKRE